jgi:hypothetical protein
LCEHNLQSGHVVWPSILLGKGALSVLNSNWTGTVRRLRNLDRQAYGSSDEVGQDPLKAAPGKNLHRQGGAQLGAFRTHMVGVSSRVVLPLAQYGDSVL